MDALRKDYSFLVRGNVFTADVIDTKGELVVEGGIEKYYFLVSAKRAE